MSIWEFIDWSRKIQPQVHMCRYSDSSEKILTRDDRKVVALKKTIKMCKMTPWKNQSAYNNHLKNKTTDSQFSYHHKMFRIFTIMWRLSYSSESIIWNEMTGRLLPWKKNLNGIVYNNLLGKKPTRLKSFLTNIKFIFLPLWQILKFPRNYYVTWDDREVVAFKINLNV